MPQNQEQQFLPAALEIQETPPSPIGRAIIWSIVGFFLIAIAWACLGETDIVAVARGRIIPSGHSKVIQPLEIGTVRQIHVREGQAVEAGDPLIELDPSIVEADLKRLEKEGAALEQVLARLKNLAQRTDPENSEENPPPAPTGELQQRLLRSQWREHRSRIAALEREREKRKAERLTLDKQIEKLRATVPLATRRAEDLKKLADNKVVAEHRYLEVEQERIEQVHDLNTQRSRKEALDAALREIEEQQQTLRAEFRHKVLSERAEAERQLTAIDQEIIKARSRTNARRLVAPVAGVVQQLAVHTIGGIVTPAQELLVIVPRSDALEVEARLENKDIGFVQAGQAAEVKVETFPFTRYGTIAGDVVTVSGDAIADEKQGLVYHAKVRLERSVMRVNEREVNLSPGMAVTVEIKTGKRRLIEFLMSPLLRYRDESGRER